MRLEAHQAALVVGLRGSGKTYFTNHTILPAHETAAVWDPHANYDVAYYQLGKVPSYAQKWGHRVSFHSAKAYCDAFILFAAEAFKRRPQVIIVDEVPLLMMHKSGEDSLVMLATQSRHAGAALVIVAQRAFTVPLTVRTQCSEYVSFQQVNQHDIRAIERDTETAPLECAGAPTNKCGAPAQCLKHLPRGKFFHATIRG
jgi:hypothetical protein